jgi:CubicO group peptidase (beta-lactamase class C family)
MAANEMGVDDGVAPLPEPSRRRAGWERWLAGALLVAFFFSVASSFVLFPQLRFVFTAVPVTLATHAPLTSAAPAPADVSPAALDSVETLVEKEVLREGFPGAALAVGEGDRTLLEAGIGRTSWSRLSAPVDADETVYDLASLTKVMATTTAVMLLVDDDRLHLDDRVVHWLPDFTGDGREKVTIRNLLTHTSGLQAGMKELEGDTPEQKFHYLLTHARMLQQPGEMVLYSDVGFIILGRVVELAAGEPMDSLLERRVWAPLGMSSTRFQPGLGCRACAPTLTLDDGTPFAGETNDPLARQLGGKTGNAGLFSTAHDVARYAAMLAGGGALDSVRVVQEETLHEFVQPQPGAGTRALGFEVFCREGTVPDEKECRTPYAFGHTGYTGTSLWVDPARGIWVVLLSNRSYDPHAPNRIQTVRRRLFDLATDQPSSVSGTAGDTMPEVE